MKAKQLTVTLTFVTLLLWLLFALTSSKFALFPLLALMSSGEWTPTAQGEGNIRTPLLMLSGLAYCLIPLVSWTRESKILAWLIPVSPLLGAGIWFARFYIMMANWN